VGVERERRRIGYAAVQGQYTQNRWANLGWALVEAEDDDEGSESEDRTAPVRPSLRGKNE
jgi:hypothetical protein